MKVFSPVGFQISILSFLLRCLDPHARDGSAGGYRE